MDVDFREAERGVREVRPAGLETAVPTGGTGSRLVVVTVATQDFFRAGAAVVADEQDQRVVEGVHGSQLVEQAAGFAVDAVDHRGMNLHAVLPFGAFGSERLSQAGTPAVRGERSQLTRPRSRTRL